MVNSRFTAELANRIAIIRHQHIHLDDEVIPDSNPVRAHNVSEALYRYRKLRLTLLKYLEERKPT